MSIDKPAGEAPLNVPAYSKTQMRRIWQHARLWGKRASVLTGAAAIILGWMEADSARVRDAWKLATQTHSADSGRREALQYLHRRGELLVHLDLSAQKGMVETYLADMNLARANLTKSDFTRSLLHRTSFFHTNLEQTKFIESKMQCANIEGARLRGTNFAGAILNWANLSNVDNNTNINSDSRMNSQTSFYGASLHFANLSGVNFAPLLPPHGLTEASFANACVMRGTSVILPQGLEHILPTIKECGPAHQCPPDLAPPQRRLPSLPERLLLSLGINVN